MTRTASLLTAAALTGLLAVPSFAAKNSGPQVNDLTPTFRTAALNIDRLQVFEVGGVVLIRGRATDAETVAAAGRYAQSLGYQRVANLVQVADAPDDAAIERAAERELTIHRSLDGCRFAVNAEAGVVKLQGTVKNELQKDVALSVVRNIDGVRSVQMALNREE